MSERLRWGVLGAADIARKAVIPAIAASRNGQVVAIASRDPERARAVGVGRVMPTYDALLEAGDVDAVYIPVVNSLHHEWTIRALAAGKHVLCEKPLAMNASEAEAMAAAAARHGKLLMEGFMYRFHPRIRQVVAEAHDVRELWASFGFRLRDPANYRARPELGGGALYDVGCYVINLTAWILGQPQAVDAEGKSVEGLDTTVSVELGFASGAKAHLFCSIEVDEIQELRLDGIQIDKPFTAWKDPDDPYRLMVEAFADAVFSGSGAPLSLQDSISNLRVMDLVRRQLGLGDLGHRDHLPEAGQ